MSLWMGYPPLFLIGIPIVCLAILAFCRKDSLWGSIIKLFNVMFASLIAINFFGPVANILDGVAVVMAYYNDMLAFLIIFTLAMGILTEVTNRISKVNVVFPEKANLIGTLSLMFIMFVGFYGITAFMFMTLMPEAPRMSDYKSPPTFDVLQYISKYPLKPMTSNPCIFDKGTFLNDQNKRNFGVYAAVEGGTGSSEGTWQFSGGSSPNVSGGN